MGQEQFGRGNVWANAKEAGIWKDIPFNQANFGNSLGGLSLALTPAKIANNRYTRIGNTIIWHMQCFGGTLGGSASDTLALVPPVSRPARYMGNQIAWMYDGVATLVTIQPDPTLAYIPVVPFPNRFYTLGGGFQLKMLLHYEIAP